MNTITFDDNIVVMKLKDFKNASDSRNRFYKCWRAKIEECENLQSKIDKANEYINTIKDNTPNTTRKDFAKMILINYEFLSSILKEDK